MDRRKFLQILAGSGASLYAMDLDKLLWVPGKKKIFIPSNRSLTMAQIIDAELARITPNIERLFERDDLFYSVLKDKSPRMISSREMRVPLIIRPQGKWEKK